MSECHTLILNVFSRRQQVCVLEFCLRHQTQVVDSTSFILLFSLLSLLSSSLSCVCVCVCDVHDKVFSHLIGIFVKEKRKELFIVKKATAEITYSGKEQREK